MLELRHEVLAGEAHLSFEDAGWRMRSPDQEEAQMPNMREYNDTGSAKPFTGPEARKWRKVWEKEQQQKSAAQIAAEERAADSAARALIAEVARAQAAGLSFDEEGNELQAGLTQAAPATPQPSAPIVPAGWRPDPTGRYQLRYWDSAPWTAHVSIQGVQGSDPM